MKLLVELLAAATVVGLFAGAQVWRYYRPERRRHRTLLRTKLWRIGELPEDTVGRVAGTGIGYEPTQRQLDLLAAHGERSRGAVFNRRLSYREEIIEEGETICVAGAGVREGDPEAPAGEGYRTAPVTRLRFASSTRFRLLITDAPPETERRSAD